MKILIAGIETEVGTPSFDNDHDIAIRDSILKIEEVYRKKGVAPSVKKEKSKVFFENIAFHVKAKVNEKRLRQVELVRRKK